MNKQGFASIFKFKKTGKVLIHSSSQMQMGGSIATEPFIWLDEKSSIEDVVKGLVYAMDQTKAGLPRPVDWASFGKEYVKSLGLKKLSDLYKDTISVEATRINNKITFIPMINTGRAFQSVSDTIIETETGSSVEELATSLELAFSKCE